MALQRKKLLETDASQMVVFLPPHPILAIAVHPTPLRVERGRKSYVQRTLFWGEVDRDNLGCTFKKR